MKPPRPPMSPPDLDGYDPIGLLGSGGFSDVFLYERRFPRQQVAIKVLVPGALGDRAVELGFIINRNQNLLVVFYFENVL